MKATEKIDGAIERKFRNIVIEYQIVAYALRRSPPVSALIVGEWFSLQPLNRIIEIIRLKRVQLTNETLMHELRASKVITKDNEELYSDVIVDLFKAAIKSINDSNIQTLIKQLYELYESRRCLEGIKDVLTDLRQFDLPAVKGTLRDLGRASQLVDPFKSGEYLEDYETRRAKIDALRKAREEQTDDEDIVIGIATGIPKFDRTFKGLMPTEFGVVVGEPGIGKTTILIQMASHGWLHGHNVVFASGEMSKELIEFRLDSSLAGIAATKFRDGDLTTKELKRWRSKINALRTVQESFLEIVAFPRAFTAETVEAEMLRVQEKHERQVDLLLIDYVNIMDPIGMKSTRKDWQSQADAVWDVKALTADFNDGICTWTAGQIQDQFIGAEKLTLESPKYARAISETAPIVVGLVKTEDDELDGTLQLQVLKMRNAPLLRDPIILHPSMDMMRIHQEFLRAKDLLELEEDVLEERKRERERKRTRGRSRNL